MCLLIKISNLFLVWAGSRFVFYYVQRTPEKEEKAWNTAGTFRVFWPCGLELEDKGWRSLGNTSAGRFNKQGANPAVLEWRCTWSGLTATNRCFSMFIIKIFQLCLTKLRWWRGDCNQRCIFFPLQTISHLVRRGALWLQTWIVAVLALTYCTQYRVN